MTDSKSPEHRDEQEDQQRNAASEEEKSKLSNPKPPEDRDEKKPEEWYERTRYQLLLFAGGIALFVVGALVLDWYINPQTSTQKTNVVQALGLITVGVAGAIGIFFTWRGQRNAREVHEDNQKNTLTQLELTRQSQEQQQESTNEELRLTRQGQITERFTRAIDQLGSGKLEIRLGGIYALEKIDRESPERAYHSTVMEVLTAYVRENSRLKHEEASAPTSASNADTEQGEEGVEQDMELYPQRLPADIRAIIDVLTRRDEERIPEEQRVLLDLQGAILYDANLQGADLQGAILYGAILQGADLQGADLREAFLYDADLQGAHLREAFLQGANLQGADLQGAILYRANLQGAHLTGLQGSGLREAILQEAILQEAQLQEAQLQDVNLQDVNLQDAQLQRANLEDADLQRADLQGVGLQGASILGANLLGANLQLASFVPANADDAWVLGEACLMTQDQIEWTIGSNEIKLPESLTPPKLWSKSVQEQEKLVKEHIDSGE